MTATAGPQPLFVVGTGRCGSTLLYELLHAHPRVVMTNEARLVDFLYFVNAFAAQPAYDLAEHGLYRPVQLHGLVGREYVETFAAVVRDHTGPLLVDFYRRQFPGVDFAYFGDKLPRAEAAGAFSLLFPGMRCFTLARDPRDVACSLRDYTKRPEVQAGDPFFRIDDLAAWCTQWAGLYGGCLDHMPGNLLLRYEDLVQHPERELRKAMAHLGLEVDPAQLDWSAREATRRGHATTASAAASVERWRRDLPAEDLATIERICGPVMHRCGYAPAG